MILGVLPQRLVGHLVSPKTSCRTKDAHATTLWYITLSWERDKRSVYTGQCERLVENFHRIQTAPQANPRNAKLGESIYAYSYSTTRGYCSFCMH